MKRKILKVLKIIIIVILVIILIVYLFLHLWPSIGGRTNKSDWKLYESRATNFENGRFKNKHDVEFMTEGENTDFVSSKDKTPEEIIESVSPSLIENLQDTDLTITWLGHSSLLIQMSKLNILIDPVFSDYTSPVKYFGPKRFSTLPIELKNLPKIDAVLITHDHYDHLDYETIKYLSDKVDKFIVPLGVEKHLIRWKVSKEKIESLAWWEETKINDLLIGCTPAQHFSGRGLFNRNETLWASYILKNDTYQIFESGDTGYNTHFNKIFEKYGAFDLALLENGQYDAAWSNIHMKPEQSVQAGIDLHASLLMPIHWGTFSISRHGWDDSPERFTSYAEKQNVETLTPKIGQTINYEDYTNYKEKWWQNIK